ncbi:MAG TPA: NAD-dependent epimerase/dehydratase family protein [Acidimicrobiales bacterium]
MTAVVTGVAGFVGSHLAEALVEAGHRVVGIDCLTDYYDAAAKRQNLRLLGGRANFEFVLADLRTAELEPMLAGADVVFHQAGQPGVRKSWSTGFVDYSTHNIVGTQRLLEAARRVRCPRVVYASSSSVYGNAPAYPTSEASLPHPHSPYGVTKLAAEHLCSLYAANWGLPTVSLRYFTVYGPRQRPDMAFRRLIDAAVDGRSFALYGSGRQVRDFTYVGDVVAANLAAGGADVAPGTVVNIAGGASASMNEVIELVGELTGAPVALERQPAMPGDVERTGGTIDAADRSLGWAPVTSLRDGLEAQVAWSRRRLAERDRRSPIGAVDGLPDPASDPAPDPAADRVPEPASEPARRRGPRTTIRVLDGRAHLAPVRPGDHR